MERASVLMTLLVLESPVGFAVQYRNNKSTPCHDLFLLMPV